MYNKYSSVDAKCCKCKKYRKGYCKGLLEYHRNDCPKRFVALDE